MSTTRATPDTTTTDLPEWVRSDLSGARHVTCPEATRLGV
jgi:hypothetical protein